MKKKIIMLTIVATLAIGITACAGTEQANSNPTSTVAPTVEAETTTPTDTSTLEPSKENTVEATETAGTEETTDFSEETTGNEDITSLPASDLEGKTLIVTALGKSIDLLSDTAERFGDEDVNWYHTGFYGFDFEVLGVKGSEDLSTKDELINAFTAYFGEPTGVYEETYSSGESKAMYQWYYDDRSSINLEFTWGQNSLYKFVVRFDVPFGTY